jgi:hypothetical protein
VVLDEVNEIRRDHSAELFFAGDPAEAGVERLQHRARHVPVVHQEHQDADACVVLCGQPRAYVFFEELFPAVDR